MKVEYIKNEKNEAEIQVDNITIVEILRHYLSKNSDVSFVAWKREHPSKAPVLKITTKGKSVKKVVSDAVDAIEKDTAKLVAEFKKNK